LLDLYKEVTELVGIDGGRDGELIKLLDKDGDVSENKLKVVSVVGFGGLGKTTLVNAVYNKIKSDYDCSVFVPVGQNADVKKVLRDIHFDLRCTNENLQVFLTLHMHYVVVEAGSNSYILDINVLSLTEIIFS
jgi:adenylate kinase